MFSFRGQLASGIGERSGRHWGLVDLAIGFDGFAPIPFGEPLLREVVGGKSAIVEPQRPVQPEDARIVNGTAGFNLGLREALKK